LSTSPPTKSSQEVISTALVGHLVGQRLESRHHAFLVVDTSPGNTATSIAAANRHVDVQPGAASGWRGRTLVVAGKGAASPGANAKAAVGDDAQRQSNSSGARSSWLTARASLRLITRPRLRGIARRNALRMLRSWNTLIKFRSCAPECSAA
jgi:hypothetical protein